MTVSDIIFLYKEYKNHIIKVSQASKTLIFMPYFVKEAIFQLETIFLTP